MKTEVDIGDWSEAATSQGTSRIARKHWRLGRGKEGVFPRAFRGSMALLTP